jgi:hypothetical protein
MKRQCYCCLRCWFNVALSIAIGRIPLTGQGSSALSTSECSACMPPHSQAAVKSARSTFFCRGGHGRAHLDVSALLDSVLCVALGVVSPLAKCLDGEMASQLVRRLGRTGIWSRPAVHVNAPLSALCHLLSPCRVDVEEAVGGRQEGMHHTRNHRPATLRLDLERVVCLFPCAGLNRMHASFVQIPQMRHTLLSSLRIGCAPTYLR